MKTPTVECDLCKNPSPKITLVEGNYNQYLKNEYNLPNDWIWNLYCGNCQNQTIIWLIEDNT